MKIILGSTNEDKKKILEKALLPFIGKISIKGINVSSGIIDQPLDENTTIEGARNRAINVSKLKTTADLYVGLEGGLHKVDDKNYFLVCVATFCDSSGQIYIGVSSKIQLPKEVSARVGRGESFGGAIREYREKYSGDEMIKQLVDELITRKKSFEEAVRNAYCTYANKKHFS